jgi:hypothetical protein
MKKQVNKQIIQSILLMGLGFLWMWAGTGQNSLKSSGDFVVHVEKADADMFYMEAIKIWRITISTPPLQYKKTSKQGTAHLFFSRDFNLEAKEYPIAFSYLNKKDTLGGTFFYREMKQKTNRFTHDTVGRLTVTKVGETLEGTFSYKVYSGSKEPRKSVTVTGKFSIPVKPDFLKK